MNSSVSTMLEDLEKAKSKYKEEMDKLSQQQEKILKLAKLKEQDEQKQKVSIFIFLNEYTK